MSEQGNPVENPTNHCGSGRDNPVCLGGESVECALGAGFVQSRPYRNGFKASFSAYSNHNDKNRFDVFARTRRLGSLRLVELMGE